MKLIQRICRAWPWISKRRAERERLAAIREACGPLLEALRYPENGVHYCRWCNAGTHNGWQHDEYCVYEARCRQINAVRAAFATPEEDES